ncbi:MAG: hypothetical protein JNM72_21285 [Deltaproteobacteria bacterium]|nr:hypothetical protein [Deltaproteobacteria bacterium]
MPSLDPTPGRPPAPARGSSPWAWALGCATLVLVLPAATLALLLAALRDSLPPPRPAARAWAAPAPLPAASGDCGLRVRVAPAEAYVKEPPSAEAVRAFGELRASVRGAPNEGDVIVAHAQRSRLRFDPQGSQFEGAAVVRIEVERTGDAPASAPVQLEVPLGVEHPVGGLPCGAFVRLSAWTDAAADLERFADVEPEDDAIVELRLRPLAPLKGRVLDADGAPVEGALVEVAEARADARPSAPNAGVRASTAPLRRSGWPMATARTGPDGRFALPLPRGPHHRGAVGEEPELRVLAVAEGALPAAAWVPALDAPTEPWPEVELRLAEARGVAVICQGFPDGGCPELRCGGPMTPRFNAGECVIGDTALLPADDAPAEARALCHCPDTDAVVRGGGLEVSVPDDVDLVVLDPGDGGVKGLLLGHLPDDEVTVRVHRIAPDIYTVVRMTMRSESTQVQPDGRWELVGLAPGDWSVEISRRGTEDTAPEARAGRRVHLARVRVGGLQEGELRDLGAIDPANYGGIALRCIDPLTGVEVGRSTPSKWKGGMLSGPESGRGLDFTGVDCGYTAMGLAPGPWTVDLFPMLWDSATVEVHAGRTAQVTLGGEAEDPLDAMGLELSVDEEGLLVDEVLAGGDAEALGLRTGDRVRGVQVAGRSMPLEELVGEDGELEVMSALVGIAQWAGAAGAVDALGLGLEVERSHGEDGGELVALPVRFAGEEE